MKYTVFYNGNNGEIVFSTTLPLDIDNMKIAEFDVESGKTLVSVDVSKKEHSIIAEDNPISETAKNSSRITTLEKAMMDMLASQFGDDEESGE